ncbi:hypothetical protein CWI82_01475 [Pseudidiomarina tainanensis]|jgi:hypothetical protein|uniref:Cytochrome oxidase Cu insertion factor (SCO1/SenC/PrrC family) n=2 Tax=Pseudidiomarina TaxID=2800384 RepID=A0A1I6HGV1_9GAMM|nr:MULTISPECIES: hypothetical protein [Pseudidiomarina]RZQ56010.1 hypothetical protein CWI82_01475 [Pseudidiomarina tainanensis]SFR53726.1 hypothetical protein SAMN04488070_1776 [Pseudidiomarina maritima]
MTNVKRSRATLIGVALAFLIPVIGAKLVLDQHWYQGAVTNKGTMLVPPIELRELNAALPEGWRVALVDDGQCSDACMQGLYAMNQLDVALGKETDRVNPILITSAGTALDLNRVPLVKHVENSALELAVSQVPAHHLFIIDPLGNVVLHYPTYAEEEAMRAEAKNLLADLRTLLKLSKVG